MTDQLVPAIGPFLEQILRESFPLWGDGLSYDAYVRYWEAQRRTAWGATHLDRVAIVEQGRVTSSAKRYDFGARIDGRIRRVLGIGAVFTSPDRRGRGGARRLIESMLEAAEVEGFEYAMLFSEIDPAFYEALEFVPIPLLESRLEVNRMKGGAPAVLIRAGDDRDLASIVEMSAERGRSARFAIDRCEDLIKFGVAKRRLLSGLGPPGLRATEFLVTEEGHQAVAYLISTVHQGQWFIEEAGDRDPAGARVGAMLQAMLARAPREPVPPIFAWLPQGFTPPQVTRLESHATSEVLMVRPLKNRTLPLPPLEASQVVYWRSDYF